MRLSEALGKGTGLLAFGGIDRKGRDARLLLAHAIGGTQEKLISDIQRDITDAEWETYHACLTRRLDHEPVSRIIGQRMFWGRNFRIGPQVLDPRPETESLIAEVLGGPAPKQVLDLGTGSGIIAVTLAAELPAVHVVATDLSAEALGIAGENARIHGVAERVRLIESDWFGAVEGAFDLIVSNPPYISAGEMSALAPEVRIFDPHIALTDNGDGLDAYRAIVSGAARHLTDHGRLMVEIGASQGAEVRELFNRAGFEGVQVLPDLDGRDRVVSGIRSSNT